MIEILKIFKLFLSFRGGANLVFPMGSKLGLIQFSEYTKKIDKN